MADLSARIAARPQDASLYLRRGELHRAHADWDAAARDYHRAREIDPGLDAVDLCMGRMLVEAGRPARGLASLDRFLARHPDHPGALAERGRALAHLGRGLEAARSFTLAIARHRPADAPAPDLFLERARALAGSRPPRLDEAIRGLDEGMATLGPLVSLGFYAIDLETRLARYDAALTRLDRLAARSPRKESYLVRRGDLLEAAARPEDARQAYSQALAAIQILPAERRSARAVLDLEIRARSGLARGSPSAGTAGREPQGGGR
jgi:predicted Zn-dependent protease